MTQIVNGIFLPDRDIHFGVQILNSPLVDGRGTYQLEKIKAGIAQCKSFNTAIDVGANVGLWTRVLSPHFRHIDAVEPIHENIDCMMYNLSDCFNIKIHTLAVSREIGYLPMTYMEDAATAMVSRSSEAHLHVACKPLDDFGFENVSFIKIDVEGYENNVILSGEKLIRRDKPTIVVEQKKRTLKYDNMKFRAIQTLAGWGMEIAWEMSGDFCLTWN